MALPCTRCGLIGADVRPDAFRQNRGLQRPADLSVMLPTRFELVTRKNPLSIFQTSFLRLLTSGAVLRCVRTQLAPGCRAGVSAFTESLGG